ncbi:MAG: gliding motility-associated C-terminal domain-containing protein [Flavobacterium sp.]|nr:gliding motility-associated C-terminal domain-containing protein [Flavobacterium sp.]
MTSFFLLTENCPPTVYNAVSPNNDYSNDTFFIDGLRDIFVNFELLIYNRWGKHLWTGNNNKPDWDGYVEDGVGSTLAPAGTYYYILYLNDPNYPEPLTGYLYINR